MSQEAYPDRDLAAQGSLLVLPDVLQSIFVSEVLYPSPRLWICSPLMSNIEVIDNTARQFGSLDPDWPVARIRLSTVLNSLLERGAQIVVVMRSTPHNDEFLACLAPLQAIHGTALQIIRASYLDQSEVVGDYFTLSGSMHLTYPGIHANVEHLIYRCDPRIAAEHAEKLEKRWSDDLCS